MQKGNPVIKNYILSPEKYTLGEKKYVNNFPNRTIRFGNVLISENQHNLWVRGKNPTTQEL